LLLSYPTIARLTAASHCRCVLTFCHFTDDVTLLLWHRTAGVCLHSVALPMTSHCCYDIVLQVCAYTPCTNSQVCPPGVGVAVPPNVANISCIQEGWSSILHWNGTQHRKSCAACRLGVNLSNSRLYFYSSSCFRPKNALSLLVC
jgi:hypothetical protein